MNDGVGVWWTPRQTWVGAAVAAVLVWRVAAFLRPSSMIVIAEPLRLPLTLLGVFFAACGVWAWWARPGRWTTIFLAYALGGAVHWGGSVGPSQAGAELALLLVYVACSALSEAALLHLALVYPGGSTLAPLVRGALYLPAAVALALAPVAGVLPRPVLEAGIGVVLLVASLLSLVAAAVFVVRLARADATLRRAARLPLIVAALVVGGGLSLAAGAGLLPGGADGWNLVLALVPFGLGIALATERVGSTGH